MLGCELAIVRLQNAVWISILFTLVTSHKVHVLNRIAIGMELKLSALLSISPLSHEGRSRRWIQANVVLLNQVILFFEVSRHSTNCELQNVVQAFLFGQL